MTNPHLSARTAGGTAADVAVEWDQGNDQWWNWYMSLADGAAPEGPLVEVAPHDPGPLPSDAGVAAELAEPYPITDAQVALSKEPGAGRTPWHFDAHHFPLDSPDVLTAWMPLQPTPREMGPLAFARGADTWRLAEGIEFDKHGTSYDRGVSEAFRTRGVEVEDGPFAAGEVSFHGANCVHTAGANRTTTARVVLATTYFADGVRIVESPTMVSGDWRKFVPGAEPGRPVTSPNNPVLADPVAR